MKNIILTGLYILIFASFGFAIDPPKSMADSMDYFDAIYNIEYKIDKLNNELEEKTIELQIRLNDVNYDLLKPELFTKDEYHNLYLKKLELEKEYNEEEKNAEIQKLRYRFKKGVEILKLLYEKILGLDHHFSGMQTLQNIMVLSNPNSYPEFRRSRSAMENKVNKKFAFDMPALFDSNVYLSATYSLVTAFLGDGGRKEKTKMMDDMACVMDFTVSMNSELGVILHETEYLKKSNERLKLDCEKTFENYMKVIKYLVPFSKCREEDDWETVYANLDDLIENSKDNSLKSSKNLVNMEFAINRVNEMIREYNNFINEGTQYYEKFYGIVDGYANKDRCIDQLPHQFDELKYDIKTTIDKFQNTYRMPDVQGGTRQKELNFGNTMK